MDRMKQAKAESPKNRGRMDSQAYWFGVLKKMFFFGIVQPEVWESFWIPGSTWRANEGYGQKDLDLPISTIRAVLAAG